MNKTAVKNYLIKNIREVQEFNSSLPPMKYFVANTGAGVLMVLITDYLLRKGVSRRKAWSYGILSGQLFAQAVTFKEQVEKGKKKWAELKAERTEMLRDDDPYTNEEAEDQLFMEPIVIDLEPGASEEEMQARVQEALDRVKSSVETLLDKHTKPEERDEFTKRIGFNL